MATSSFYNSSGSTPAVANSIQTAVTQAAGSATQAATSATQATTSATNAQNSLNSFQQYYLGAYTSAPSTTQSGAMYFNTSVGQLYIWSGSSWDVTASANNLQDTDGLSEGSTNLYFTNARAASAITGSDLDMNGNKVLFANVYTSEVNLPSANTYHGMFAHVHGTGKGYFAHAGSWHKLLDETSSTTTDLSEGSNLYYTNERVDDRVSNLLTAGSNITLTYNDSANTLTIASTASGGGGSTTFTGLTDTPSSMGTSGQYLAVNSGATALEFVAAPSGGGATTLSGLNDVSNATPANGQVLTYDTSTSLWQPITPSGGSSGSSTFTGLTDTPSSFTASKFVAVNSGGTALEYATALTPSNLTVTNTAASGGGSVSYIPGANGATLNFTPPDLSSYLTGITGQSLYNLSNVNSSASPSDGQVLAWDNANSYWTPVAASSGGGGIALTDLSATTGAAGTAALSYNSTTGVFTLTPPDLSGYATTSSLATVATSGAYGDLTGTPNLSGYLTGITGESLYSLSNVYTSSSPTDGQVLTWDNANSYWKPTTVSAGSSGIALTDLSASNATASGGGSLAYNNSTGAFTFTPPALSGYATTSSLATVATSGAYADLSGTPNLSSYLTGITGESLYSLSNVYSSSNPSDGQVLTYDTTNGWQPETPSTFAAANYVKVNTSSGTTSAGGTDAIAIGYIANSSANKGISIGYAAKAAVAADISIGQSANNSAGGGGNSIGIGNESVSDGLYATALGFQADAGHTYAVAIGTTATTTVQRQLMLGAPNNSAGFTSIRVGNTSYTPSDAMDLTTKSYVDARNLADLANVDSTAPTDGQVLTWDNANSYWKPATASGGGGGGLGIYGSVNSSGSGVNVSGSEAVTIGASTINSGVEGVAIGKAARVSHSYGISIGGESDSRANYGIAMGYSSQLTSGGTSGIVIGHHASTNSPRGTSIGAYSLSGQEGVALGGGSSTTNRTQAGYQGVGIGFRANAYNNYAVAIGGYSSANGSTYTTALGYASQATGQYATALGYAAVSSQWQITLGSTNNNALRCNVTSITSLSDRRDKTEITDLDLGLDFVNAIAPKSFYRNERGKYYIAAYTPEQLAADDTLVQSYTFDQTNYDLATQKADKKEFGWVAQDVDAQLPAAHSDARLTFNETDDLQDFDVQRFTAGDMLPIAWKALRELSDKHDQLQSDYDALLARVVALENA